MPVSILNTGTYEPILYFLHAVILGSCAVQLFRRYLETREKITLLFTIYFTFMVLMAMANILLVLDVVTLDLLHTMAILALIAMGFVTTIGVVLLGVKQVYLLPAIIVLVALLHYNYGSVTYSLTMILVRSYLYMAGMGNPWFIILKTVFPNFLSPNQQVAIMINLLLDPAEILVTNTPLITLSMYDSAIGIPTMILFYYLAWSNKSGRSLGFALYLTTLIIWGFLVSSLMIETRSLVSLIITLVSFVFLALGIFGILDKVIQKKEKQ